ncbi:MAG: NADH-quinone oxidoreductase subunit NuoE [Candidatus Hadarchaeia archaeon]
MSEELKNKSRLLSESDEGALSESIRTLKNRISSPEGNVGDRASLRPCDVEGEPEKARRLTRLKKILADLDRTEKNVMPALQRIQEEFGYLPRVSFEYVSKEFGVPESRIYGVASFYSQFHLKPQGRHTIKICQGTACHVKGSKDIQEVIEEELDIEPGEVTDDNKFTLTMVRCLGCCSLAPVMMIDEDVYGNLTEDKVKDVLRGFE